MPIPGSQGLCLGLVWRTLLVLLDVPIPVSQDLVLVVVVVVKECERSVVR